jgi:sulfoquinovosidase
MSALSIPAPIALIAADGGFDLILSGRTLIRHRPQSPFAYWGFGEADVAMNRGNFKIEDYVCARIPLTAAAIQPLQDGGWRVALAPVQGQPAVLVMRVGLAGREDIVHLDFEAGEAAAPPFCVSPGSLRLWLRFCAEPQEHVWGGGEQMSYFDMRGRVFPLWTSEPGVGRDKRSPITFQADAAGAGGDYYHTNYPQPTYLSSRHYALHVETTAYAAFDFRHAAFHEVHLWAIPQRVEFFAGDRFADLVSALSERFGRQPPLPQWAMEGAIIGLKQGARSLERLETFLEAGCAVSGLWCEDWVGLRITSFGKRLFWDWRWNPQRYPDLDQTIVRLRERGVRFLGYVNPYLAVDGSLYAEAASAGYLALKQDSDAIYTVDFGEFDCGVVDFTQPEATEWFIERVIGQNMIDFGLSGWMADFGEYLPTDARLANGVDAMLMHNAWPVLWAKVNADAVARRGRTGDIVFFMRAGYSGVQRWCPLLWAGDQCVDFSRHDGIGTVICGALSSGLLGNAYHHSDIGGYTSLFGNVRTAELLMRWTEMAAFGPVMRSHEGNRPDDNLQLDQDAATLAHFARMTRVHKALLPYFLALVEAASGQGLPVQRPMFLEFEDDKRLYANQTQYMLGSDVLVAPVLEAGVEDIEVILPEGTGWEHLWTGRTLAGGGTAMVSAPLGNPPVFFRPLSPFAALFRSLKNIA